MSVVESVGSEDTEGSGGTEGSEGTEIHEDPAAVIASVARMAKPFPVTYLQVGVHVSVHVYVQVGVHVSVHVDAHVSVYARHCLQYVSLLRIVT
jgi:hypothetical protein